MTETVTKNERVAKAYEGFVKHMKNFLDEQQFNHEEYTNFVKWADRLGRSGEIPLFLDVFVETYVLESKYKGLPGTEPSLLGPYYDEGSPLIEGATKVMPQRPDEPGDKLVFRGNVSSVDGPLANTKVEWWQDDAEGLYSNYDSPAPAFNLRGQFYTDDNGDFEVQSIVPIPYQIPTDGPTGEFTFAAGYHAYRPAHIHIKFEHEGHETLITQVFFEGDKWLETDVASGVRSSLLTKLEDKGDHKEASLNFIMRPE
ncbi:dioxygenase family protein [Planococcus lenghuensis]|uniref:Catechol 1,2-dioxygenase n=1 Tax=Planococcus lenghuensis TaxID=2213202 RepID=A0A1Q2L2K2_9BACL|nr:dioxygenase [Planococcus lenghuensis]AQQ54646.1 catechol 1,2-dioxygenase [Planococcus lenghuensis]